MLPTESDTEISTFLETGDILIKDNYRFLTFDRRGNFKDEIEFLEFKKENTTSAI